MITATKSLLHDYALVVAFGVALFVFAAAGGIARLTDHFANSNSHSLAAPATGEINRAVRQAGLRIQHFARTDPLAFGDVLHQAFGARLDANAGRDLVAKAAQRRLPLPRRIFFVSPDVLAGAGGAYAHDDGGIIFLNDRLRAEPQTLTDVMIHEWAHHLDATLGAGDSAGEEGDIFLRGSRQGGPISTLEHRLLSGSATGHARIQFEGNTYSVELCPWYNVFCHAASVAKAVVSVGKSLGEGIAKVGKSAVALAENVGKSVVNGVKGTVLTVAGTMAAVAGDNDSALRLMNQAGSAFNDTGKSLTGGVGNILDTAGHLKKFHDDTADSLDKIVPGLGTVGAIASAVSPAGPWLAAADSITAVRDGYRRGGLGGALLAGGGELVKHGASKFAGKGLKKSRAFKGGKNKRVFDAANAGMDEVSGDVVDTGSAGLTDELCGEIDDENCDPTSRTAMIRPPAAPAPAPVSAELIVWSGTPNSADGKTRIALSEQDIEKSTVPLNSSPAIYLKLTFADGYTIDPDEYQKKFADNIVFDADGGDPGNLIEVVYWPVENGNPQRGKYAAQLAATGNDIGTAEFKVSFRNAPAVTASALVEVVSAESLAAEQRAEEEKAESAKALAALEKKRIADAEAAREQKRLADEAAARERKRLAEEAAALERRRLAEEQAAWEAEQEAARREAKWEAEQEAARQQAQWEAEQEAARQQAQWEAEQDAARRRAEWEAQQAALAAAQQQQSDAARRAAAAAAADAAAAQQQQPNQQASCYFNHEGYQSGADWGNHGAGGGLGVGYAQRLAYEGDYAFVFIVESNNGGVTCPRQLSLECSDCPPGAPIW